jgi:hypothetical protein
MLGMKTRNYLAASFLLSIAACGATTARSWRADTADAGVGSPTCDGTGNCNVRGTGCVRCAYAGPCKGAYDACQGSPDCIVFGACAQACKLSDAGTACNNRCEGEHPTGYAAYKAMIKCAFCETCRSDCNLPPTASYCW